MKKTIILYLFLTSSIAIFLGISACLIIEVIMELFISQNDFNTSLLIALLASAMLLTIACILYRKHVEKDTNKALNEIGTFFYNLFKQL